MKEDYREKIYHLDCFIDESELPIVFSCADIFILPYSKESFSVPNNLYIIGTMNSSDRSLTGLDLALRRRFTFIEMPPKPEFLTGVEVMGLDIDRKSVV